MEFLQIIINNILPLIVFVAIGYSADRALSLNPASLNKLTFYIILPGFIFYSIYTADIDLALLHVFFFCVAQMWILGRIASGIGIARGFASSKTEAFKNGTMFSNNGNIGVALIALVFSEQPFLVWGLPMYLPDALAVATVTLVQMNLFMNTLGFYQAGKSRLTPRDAVLVVLRMPFLYIIVSVFAVKALHIDLTPTFLWPVLQNVASALVAVVMMALGIQIHRSHIMVGDTDAWIACALRLIGGPICAYLLLIGWDIAGFGFSPLTAQVLFIMSAVPSAVNSVLFAMEFKNHEDFATEIVMMTTLASSVTLPLVIWTARILFPLG